MPRMSRMPQAPRLASRYIIYMRLPRLLAGLFCLALWASSAYAAGIVRVPVSVPAANVGVAGIAGAAHGAAALPSASDNPELVLSAISARYATDPSPESVADLGEGDYAEVRSGVMPSQLPSVLKAEPLVAPGKEVAIKIPYIDPGGMIAHEARVSRRLREAGGGDFFLHAVEDPELGVLVMEKLDGYRPIDEWAEAKGKIGLSAYKRIASQLKRGLEVLEAAGLVHSDLKPDNVLIGPGLRVKIVDFGITADEGGYVPYPDYEGWRGGLYVYTSENQLHNGPAAFEDDRHSVGVLLGELGRKVSTDEPGRDLLVGRIRGRAQERREHPFQGPARPDLARAGSAARGQGGRFPHLDRQAP